jgi:alpha-N-arabinofuranosidase
MAPVNTSEASASSYAATVTVAADRLAGPPISRLLFGKFTEHLGRNVYGGAWAETIENPWFAGIHQWPDPETVRKRLHELSRTYRIPELEDLSAQGIAPYWMLRGSVRAFLDRGVRGYAQRVTTEGGDAGLRTLVFLPFHRQRGIHLNVRGRANKTTRAIVRLMTVHGVELAWTDVTLHRGDWQTVERTLHRAPARQVGLGTPILLDIQFEHPVTVWLDRCSLIPSDNRYGWDPEVVAFMKEASLPLLRFPGGNFASGYHWKDGVGPADDRPILPNPAWPEIEWNDVGTDEWLQLCHLVGCKPLICVNAGNGTPEEAAEWVEYCNGGIDTPMGAFRAANGHPQPYNVKYWEVGNELYGDWQIGHTGPEEYAERYTRFREAMLAVDPTVHVIANGNDAGWNAALVNRAGETVESISVHTLAGYHIPAEADPEAVYLEYMGFAAAYENHLKDLAAPMRAAGLTPCLAITELSIFTLKPQLPNVDNLSEALYYSGIVNAAIRSQGLVELITHSALINHSAGLVKQHGVVYPHPLWWALHLYSTHPAIQPVEIAVDGPTFSCSGQWLTPVEGAPVVDAVALLSEEGNTLVVFLTNRDPHAGISARIRLDGFARHAQGTAYTLSGETFMAVNAWDAPHRVRVWSQPAHLADGLLRYTLPPHSLTRIVLTR